MSRGTENVSPAPTARNLSLARGSPQGTTSRTAPTASGSSSPRGAQPAVNLSQVSQYRHNKEWTARYRIQVASDLSEDLNPFAKLPPSPLQDFSRICREFPPNIDNSNWRKMFCLSTFHLASRWVQIMLFSD